jgi:hypothetical protein
MYQEMTRRIDWVLRGIVDDAEDFGSEKWSTVTYFSWMSTSTG